MSVDSFSDGHSVALLKCLGQSPVTVSRAQSDSNGLRRKAITASVCQPLLFSAVLPQHFWPLQP